MCSLLLPLKKEKQRFSDVFRGSKGKIGKKRIKDENFYYDGNFHHILFMIFQEKYSHILFTDQILLSGCLLEILFEF